jgi:hypothetical protein
MTRLKMNTGKYHGVRPNDEVRMIAYHADIPEQYVDKVLAKNGDYRIGNTSSRWNARKARYYLALPKFSPRNFGGCSLLLHPFL